jgi:hypothetical protein
MIHKARATCKNGHSVEFGPCNNETRTFFIFKSVCTSTDHEVISAEEIQCQRCRTIHYSRPCPQCDELIPVAKFKQKSQVERLRR